jgi:hypothetical protein
MNNTKIPTTIGATLLVIIAITVGVFVWTYEKGQDWGAVTIQPQPLKNTSPETVEQNKQSSRMPLVVAKPASEWKNVCKNVSGRYQVKYPDEWVMIVGDDMRGFQIVNDCNNVKKELLAGGRINQVMFAPSIEAISGGKSSGIWIEAIPKEQGELENTWITLSPEKPYQGFTNPNGEELNESIISGEKVVWMNKRRDGIFQHGDIQYHVSIHDDVPEDLENDFLSTFKLLP